MPRTPKRIDVTDQVQLFSAEIHRLTSTNDPHFHQLILDVKAALLNREQCSVAELLGVVSWFAQNLRVHHGVPTPVMVGVLATLHGGTVVQANYQADEENN